MSRRAAIIIGRAISPLALAGLKIYTLITKRQRVRVIVTNENDEILLLRGVISDGSWTLPGGGVNRNESTVDAAKRELYEETGIDAPISSIYFIRTLSKPELNIPFDAPLFQTKVKRSQLSKKLVNPYEIIEIRWFHIQELPSHLSNIAKVAIKELN